MTNAFEKWLKGLLNRNETRSLSSTVRRTRRQKRRESLVELLEERLVLTPIIADGGFENPIQPDNAFEQASGIGSGTLAGSQWTITGGAGITRNLSPFQNQKIPAPEGVQHGLIQANGRFSQTVSGFVVGGKYELSLLTMARQNGNGTDLEVILDRGLATEISLIDIPEVTTFGSFSEVVSPTFVATKSSYTLTIDSDNNEGALSGGRTTFFDDVAFRNIQDSFASHTVSDGARIQAEDFDLGPNGIGYFDTTAGNSGGQYRTGEDVDIEATADVGGGFNVTSIADGESLEYTADVTAGLYNVDLRVAATSAGGAIRVLVSSDPDTGFTELGTVAVPDTGGNWSTVTLDNVNLLNAGDQDLFLRLEMNGGRFDLNWFEFSAVAPKTTRAVQSGSWDDPRTWDNGIPHLLSRVIINQGSTVTLDGSDHFAGEVVVLGVLDVAESAASRSLTSRWIHVNSGGVFEIGSELDRYDEGEFVLTLTGTDPTADHVVETATGTVNVTDNDGFLMAIGGGRLQFFGEERLSFTKLGATADVGATQITVENVIERNFTDGALDGQNHPVTSAADDGRLNWEVGDRIVIASSAHQAYAQEEVRTIVAVNDLGDHSVITLDRALNYRHYGQIETYGQTHAAGTNDPGRTWDIDMRAEVALLSRNVRIQGTEEQDTDRSFGDRQRFDTTNAYGDLVKGIGGHTMIMATAGQTTVDGVQFDLMGQTGQLGRYPIHWHLAGDRTGDVLRNTSITNSNNRGLTVHGTHNLRIEGVVQHDIHGHGFFMEDGVETGNEFIANIAFGIHKVGGAVGNTDPFNVDTHDEVQQAVLRFISSAAFWITNPDNTWVGNVSAGSEGSGFWFALPTRAIGASAANPIYDGVNALRTNIQEFAHNAAHSSIIGLTFDRGSDLGGTSNRYDPVGGPPVVSHFTAYQTNAAIYHRGLEQVFDELRLADNGVGTFLTYDQEVHNSLYVGHSQGNSDITKVRRAHFLYDGPSVIADSHFAGFGEETALTFDSVGGAEKFTEHIVAGLSFENDGTYGNISNVTPAPLALNTYSVIYDGDGSLTTAVGGGPGKVVVSDQPFLVDGDGSDFQPTGWRAWVTDNRYAEFFVRRFAAGETIPETQVTTPEGETVNLVAQADPATEPSGSVSVKMPLMVEAGDYTIAFPSGFDPATEEFNIRYEIRRRNNVPENASTVLIFPGIGSTITVDGGLRVYSEAALRSATETSYFHSASGDLLLHLHTDPNASFRTPDIYTRLVARPQRTLTTAIASGNWLDASIWDNGVPDETTRAIISQGVTVTLNGPEHRAKEIVVHGTLDVAEDDQVNLLDGGFEFPVQPNNAFEQAHGGGTGSLDGAQWTISSGAGITRNISAFQSGGIPAPEGGQHGLIQNSGSFRQTVRGFVPGAEYDMSLLTMARQSGSGGSDLEAVLDAGLPSEVRLIDIPEVTFSSFTEVTSPRFVATKSSYSMTISSDLNEGALSGDRTTFFDDIQFSLITPADPAPPAAARTLSTRWIHVNSGGVFQVGTDADRFDDWEIIVTLTGADQEADHVIETATGTMNVNDNDGFLMTASGGRLQFFGEDKVSFTKLAATAEAGASTITVENIIERNFDGTTSAASDGELNWEVGDQIVLASSSYDYNDEEVRTITAVNNTGSETILTLDAPLDHRHYGEIETYGQTHAAGTKDPGRTWDIDLRAEVALLSRSITIQGTQDTDAAFGDRANYGSESGQNLGVGAHAMFMPGSGQITIDGARFDKMGQTGTLGRYPIHWHVAGDRTGDILRNSSVTNSNNRGVTIHGAQGVLVEGNVLHDIHGHGFFMEDAAETDNQFLHNITFGIHKVGGGFTSTDPFVVPGITRGGDGKVNGLAPRGENGEGSHDTGQNAPQRFVHSAAYWITNPDNTWVGNIAAGSEGTGFWFILPERVLGLSLDTGLYNGLNPLRTNLLQFDHNFAHSSQVGLTFDRGEDISGRTSSNNYAPPRRMQINNFTGYKNHGTAVYHRASVGVFNESRFADNAFGSFNTFQQIEQNVLFVGHSRGNSEPETLVGGYRLYDGPGFIANSHFAGFVADNAHEFRIEGGANKFSHTQAVGISFEDDGTADKLSIELYGDNFISVDESPAFIAGRPDSIAGLVYDFDGSLTGHGGGGPGYVLTPKVDFYRDETDLTPEGWNAYISDDRYAQLRLGRIQDLPGNYIPPFRLTNGAGHSIIADRWNLHYVQRTYTKVNAGDYTVEFLTGIPADGFDINLDIIKVTQPGDATVFRFVDAGKDYKPDRGTETASLDALRSAGSNAWFRAADGSLWMKIFESGTTIRVLPTTPIIVTNTNDSGAGSLRAAIDAANSNAGFDTIEFDIGADGSSHTIQPQTPLPTITDRVFIDGSTQAPLPVLEGGFESPVQPANDWELANGSGNGNLAGSQWTITGGAGIARNLSAWQAGSPGRVPAPEGQQIAVIQGDGSFTQTVSGFEVGQTYELSLLAMGRQTFDLGGDLKAILDAGLGTETSLIDIPEVMFPRFTEVNSTSVVATKTSYTLTMLSDQNIGTVLFDDVTFRLVSPPIVIDGSAAGASNGLEFTAPGGVDSITVNGFANGAGIQLNAPGSFVDRVWSGVDGAGTAAAPNQYGVRAEADGNTIQNSLFSGNTLAGIRVLNADNNTFTDNLIGTDPSGTASLANGTNGIELDAANGTQVIDNVIAFNSEDGVIMVNASAGNSISNNSIHSNGQLGIDLGNDGVTANDNLDADTGPNDLTNAPVITSAAAVPLPPQLLFHDTFDHTISTSITDPSARATGTLADVLAYNITNANGGEVAVTGGLLDWTGTNQANGNLEASNGSQNLTFRNAADPATHFDWAPHLAGDVYDISFTYRSAWSQPLTFGISDTPQPGNWNADESGSYDYAFGAWGSNWDSGEDGNTTRTGGGGGNTEFDVLLKINEPAGTAEAWVDGSLIVTKSIDFESSGRYFSFGEPNAYGGYIDDFRVFVMPTGTTTTVVGEMSGLANTDYELEFITNSQVDPSGHGEGKTSFGTTKVTTNASGTIEFSTTIDETIPLGQFITATATDAAGNTSEFSSAAEVWQPELTVTIVATSIGEGDGAAATTAAVWRNTDTTNALTVTLSSSDTSEATVPTTVTIPAGQSSASFDIDAVDDAILDGTQTVTITATATAHAAGTDTLDVTDDDNTGLTLTIAAVSIGEDDGAGATTATVSRNTDTTNALTVTLTSSDTSEATVPTTITIAAGQTTSAPFDVDAVDDAIADGTQTVTFTAAAPAHTDGTDTVDVTDDETAALTVTIASASVGEGDGAGSTTATVSRNTDTTNALTVTLTSSDTSEATVPSTITIAAGQTTSTPFDIDAVDDAIVDGTLTVTITAAATAHTNGTDTVDVTDDDTAGVTLTPAGPFTVSEDGTVSAFFDVMLDAEPTPGEQVVLDLTVSDSTEVSIDTTSLTFDGTNLWNVAQRVTITGVDDNIDDDDILSMITVSVNDAMTDQAAFDALSDQVIHVTTTDDDTAGVTVDELDGLSVTESGSTDTFRVSVDAEPLPGTQVTVRFTAGDTGEATVSPAFVTFTPSNWTMVRTITVTGVDDSFDDGGILSQITVSVDDTLTTDPAFQVAGKTPDQTVDVTTTDYDAAGFTLSTHGVTVSEDGTVTSLFDVTLTAEPLPTEQVVLDLTVSDSTEVSIDKTMLTFDAANPWNIAQRVTVTGIDDLFDDGDIDSTITVSVNDSDTDQVEFDSLADQTVDVTTTDNDTAGFTLDLLDAAPSGPLTVTEDGTQTDALTLVLNTQPLTGTQVVFDITSIDATEGLTSDTPVTFDSDNWNTPQTVTISGVDDLDVDGDISSTFTVAVNAAMTTDTAFNDAAKTPDQTVAFTTQDDEVAEFDIVESDGFSEVAEVGTTDTFTVVLRDKPLSNVTLSVTSTDPSEVAVDKPTLTFTPMNWSAPQAVTATGADDLTVDGDKIIPVRVAVVPDSSDDLFDQLPAKDVDVTVTDDEVATFSVTEPVDGSFAVTMVSERRTSDTLAVVLGARPESDVVLSLSMSDATEATLNASQLRFTPSNWNLPRQVVVTGVDDPIVDGPQISVLTVAVNTALSNDLFDALPPQMFDVTTLDNDHGRLLVSSPTGTIVSESGASQSFQVLLAGQPLSDVVLDVVSSDTTETTVDKPTLTFEGSNWNIPQTVTVTGMPDMVLDGSVLSTITVSVNAALSNDFFDAAPSAQRTFRTSDIDVAAFTVTEADGLTSVDERGTQDTFSVVLDAAPQTDVVLNVTASDLGEATVDRGMLTFTSLNWSTPQTVTVTGINDAIADGTALSTVTVAVNAAASNDAFDTVPAQIVSVSTTDDETPGFTITESDGDSQVSESGTSDTFTVVLDAQPAGDVVLTVTSDDLSMVAATPTTLTFTADNWNTPETVSLSGQDDGLVNGDRSISVKVSVDAAQSDDGYIGLGDQAVSVLLMDDEAAGFEINAPAGGLEVMETGTQDTFTVVLMAQPQTNVVLDVSSDDTSEATASTAQLTFTPDNWGTPQPVTVTGVDDTDDDGDLVSQIIVAINTAGSDDLFDAVVPQATAVTTSDDEGIDLVVTLQQATDLSVSANGSGDVVLTLSGDGLANVVASVNGIPAMAPFAAKEIKSITVSGSDAANSIDLSGVSPADFTFVTGVAVIVEAGGGNDAVIGSAFGDDLTGNAGDDVLNGGAGDDSLFGGAGKDALDGGDGNDELFGQGTTGDSLTGGTGDDLLDGGAGNDVIVEFVSGNVTLTNSTMTGIGNDTVINLQRARLVGNRAPNQFDLSGFFTPGLTSTSVFGGGGDDIVFGSPASDRVSGEGGNDLVFGGAGNDRLFGNSGADTLNGEAGDDRLRGHGGSGDWLNGGSGVNTLNGGRGFDRVVAAADVDFTLTDTQLIADGTNSLMSFEGASVTGGASDNVLDASAVTIFQFVILSGLGGNDTLIGGDTRNLLRGGNGDDVLTGGPRADLLRGNNGDDLLTGGGGDDELKGDDDDDTLLGQDGNDTLDGGRGNDGLSGAIGNDLLLGKGGNDLLLGGMGEDQLVGSDGADILIGGLGLDELAGQGGSDTLVRGIGDGTNQADAFDNLAEVDDFFTLNPLPGWVDEV